MKPYIKEGRKIASTWGRTSKSNKRVANKGVRKANKTDLRNHVKSRDL